MKILNRIFGKPEEINGGHRCPTYLYRWILWTTRWFKVYLHHFVADDWSLDLHDHPKRFISIGLFGSYLEQTPDPDGLCRLKLFRAPWIRSFPAHHIHRLLVPSKDCWTLVIVTKEVRDWGFWHYDFYGRARFIHWKSYVYGADKGIADKMKGCN